MSKPKFYTLGTSNREPPEFIQLLKKHDITLVIDVRSKNGSRVLHFDESRYRNLSAMLRQNGIAYNASLHQKLGGLQNGKMTLGNFREYTKTEEYFEAIEELKFLIGSNKENSVIICCERDVKNCHRKLIAETLAKEGFSIVHL